MKKIFFLSIVVCVLFTESLWSQQIPSPTEFLGYELGTHFSRHHQVVDYFNHISQALENVELQKYGETHERRSLYVAYISSKENMARLQEIRENNLMRTGLLKGNAADEPIAIVWLSYNVHGNESSGTEAAMQTLYELVTEKQDLLEKAVVIIDPCINPDGRDRYVNWYNQMQNTPYNSSKNTWEHLEPWPGGRANHYLFDLNRDWAWLTQIESQQRLRIYNQWLPHIHVDFHEQGINEPYYFAPAAAPYHEVISDWQKDFQREIGRHNAGHFDREGWRYFTREHFDLLYPSYGDTYPTFLGAIGMTYEQAGGSRAGLGVRTEEGSILSLKDRIAHHTKAGISTVEVSVKNADRLTREFQRFFHENKHFAYQSYVIKNNNRDHLDKLKALLDKHEITYQYAKKGFVKGYDYHSLQEKRRAVNNNDLVISVNQPKGKMVKVLFEPNTLVTDLTYDITAWSLPYAYGLDALASKSLVPTSSPKNSNKKPVSIDKQAHAYLHKWNSLNDAAFLSALLQEEMVVRYTKKPFSLEGTDYPAGSLILLRGDNTPPDFAENLEKIARKHNRQLNSVGSGFLEKGGGFGSSHVEKIHKKKVGVLAGKGVSSLSFGEIWHFFEVTLNYPLHVLNTAYLNRLDITDYDVLLLPDGWYHSILNEPLHKKLRQWVARGGKLILIENALESFADREDYALKRKEAADIDLELVPYKDRERKFLEMTVPGSIFNSKVDTSHPLAIGYQPTYYSLKRNDQSYAYLEAGENVAYFDKYTRNIAGIVGNKAMQSIPESLLLGIERMGKGQVVYMVDNPLYRSFWITGKLFVANAVLF